MHVDVSNGETMSRLKVLSFAVSIDGYGAGAWILGRNMFGPVRGPWPDDRWKG